MILGVVREAGGVSVGRGFARGKVVAVRGAYDWRRGDGGEIASTAGFTCFARIIGVGDRASGEISHGGKATIRAVTDGIRAAEVVDDLGELAFGVVKREGVVVPIDNAGERAGAGGAIEGIEFPIAGVGERNTENVVGEGAFAE